MAYKFQLGAAKLSGSIESTGGLVNTDVDDQTAANIVAEIDDGEIPSAKLADLSAFDTADLAEGSNLYYTQARFDAALTAKDTDDLSEGSSNLYYQDSRARAALSVDLSNNSGRGSVSYDSSTGVISYEGVTQAEIRSDISVTDAGGDGSLSYNSSTGVITYTGPSAAEVRAHLSGGEMIDFSAGEMAINASEFTASAQDVIDASAANVRAHFSVTDTSTIDMTLASGDIQASVILASNSGLDASSGLGLAGSVAGNSIDLTNGVLSVDLKANGGLEHNAGELQLDLGSAATYTVKSSGDFIAIHDIDATGAKLRKIDRQTFAADLANGALDNNSSAALSVRVDDSSIEIDPSNDLRVKALGITNSMLSGAIASSKIAELNAFDTADLAEGSNLYYTDARARAAVSVTDNGGDGSLSYDSGTGVISYTGPSATEVRAHFSVADSNSIDMSYTAGGEFSADARVDADALEVVAGGISLKSSIAGARTFQSDVTVSGDLTVNGALTYVNTTNLAISDALITIGSGSSAFAVDYGLEFGAVGSGWASIKTAQEDIDPGSVGNEDIFKFSHPVSSSFVAAGVVSATELYGDLEGAVIESVQVITAASGFNSQNTQVLCNFSSTDSITLPSAASMEGKMYKFKKIGNGNVRLLPDGSSTIDGEASITLESAYAGVSIIAKDGNYYVM